MKITKFLIPVFVAFIVFSCSSEDDISWKEISSSETPSVRYDTCSFYQESNNSFYIIGGRSSQNQRYNDVWKFSIADKEWSKVSVSGTSLDSGGRMNYCVYDDKNDIAYLYGKNGSGNALPSNILKYYVNQNKLEELASSSIPDTSLRGHSISLLKSGLSEPSLIIFGGEDAGGTINNDIRVFSINSKTFEKLNVSGTKPSPRTFHTAAISDSKLIIIGGKANSGAINDIWSFDFTTKKWTQVNSNIPLKGYYNSSFYNKNNNSILFYGGKNSNDNLSNFLKYDINENSWETIDNSPKPGALSGSAIFVSKNEYFYIFGGNFLNDKNESTSTNKTWSYFLGN